MPMTGKFTTSSFHQRWNAMTSERHENSRRNVERRVCSTPKIGKTDMIDEYF